MSATIDPPATTNGKGNTAAAKQAVAQANTVDVTGAIAKLNAARDETKDVVVESDDYIDALFLAVASGTHVYAAGEGGVGKTFGAEELAKHFGVEVFYTQFRSDTKREEVFGPLSMQKLQQDLYEHVTTGYLPEAVIANLDEFGDAGRFTRQLLNILNERWFVNGGVRHTVPLVTAIGTTNVWLEGEELAALMDRFAQRLIVEPVRTSKGFKKILRGQLEREAGIARKSKRTVVSDLELGAIRDAVKVCKVDAHMLDLIDDLRKKAKGEGLELSPRRWGEGLKLARANATLNGRQEVTEDDLRVYTRVLLNHPDDVKVARDLCKGFRDKLSVAAEDARATLDAVTAKLAPVREKHAKGDALDGSDFPVLGEANKEMQALAKKIDQAKAANGGRTNADLDRVIAEITDTQTFMQKAVLGR